MSDSEYKISKNESEVRDLLLKLIKKKNRSDLEVSQTEELKVSLSETILESKGQCFDVLPGKRDKRTHRSGYCYSNAFNMMKKSYGYVEGYVQNKYSCSQMSHAWNVDKDGIQYDFTIDNTDDLIYYGIILPEMIVLEVGFHNGGVTSSVLPFIEERK